jgi:hypothetical protein
LPTTFLACSKYSLAIVRVVTLQVGLPDLHLAFEIERGKVVEFVEKKKLLIRIPSLGAKSTSFFKGSIKSFSALLRLEIMLLGPPCGFPGEPRCRP